MNETGSDALLVWEARCRSLGLLMTTPRRAILTAMLRLGTAHDAVALLQAAREHHPATSIGTVYRLLRELEQLSLVDVQAQAHGRCRWCLHDSSPTAVQQGSGSVRSMLGQMQRFLRELERLGFVEAHTTHHIDSTAQTALQASPAPADPVITLLHEIAGRFGYRLA